MYPISTRDNKRILALETQRLLKLENYSVITKDGYVLTLTRVKVAHQNNLNSKPYSSDPVLICHGLICQGSHWLLNREEKCLPYILGRAGYDCWLANLRGTENSKKHETFDNNSQQFWDFSWDEMAMFDVPAMIDFVLKKTGKSDLFWIGHSMGSIVLFSALSMFPEYNKKIRKMVALAPSVYGRNISNFFLKLAILFGSTVSRVRPIYTRQVPLERRTISGHVSLVCPQFLLSSDKVGALILQTLGVKFGMFGKGQVETNRMPQISDHWPSTTSFKTILHMAQLYSGSSTPIASNFRHYDYGRIGNLKIYGEEVSPQYNLREVTVPVVVFSSDGDELCTPKDVEQAVKDLPFVTDHIHIADRDFSHIDFMLGKDSDTLIYEPILNIFNSCHVSYNNSNNHKRIVSSTALIYKSSTHNEKLVFTRMDKICTDPNPDLSQFSRQIDDVASW